ncbi:hypothetical protein OYT1_ch1532 [Ferriphaselus amnicola]|uniref:DUF1398 domain-containing protein n=1 Tax=Ferriphaselus amnicola TaxID=1188319 RepID=A0A2Z6GCC3_9PROT|nr:DUF1398 family protein [Ferriphaselus amnicola]BBE51080.1 hypothetical protein OYT1_ch1532 [Ferriphaselus amnicola]
MESNIVAEAAHATLNGSIPFPEVVRRLVETGVEYYHVDYVALQMTYYSASCGVLKTPINYEGLPSVASEFDLVGLRAAILDSQQNGQHFRDFTQRAINAGVQGYIAFLVDQRVTYWGRGGNQHTEWFPGAQPGKA